jgi:hypothetical protein
MLLTYSTEPELRERLEVLNRRRAALERQRKCVLLIRVLISWDASVAIGLAHG